MLYVGVGVRSPVPLAGTTGKVGDWFMATADATVNVTFRDGSSITAMPVKAGVFYPLEIAANGLANASIANAVYAVRPKG